MNFIKIQQNKKKYLRLLLLADEQESMIDRYLDNGTMYALDDDGIKAICVVVDVGNDTLELKNLAVEPAFQHRGYGKQMIAFLEQTYQKRYIILQVGTGDSPLTMPFYQTCGFQESHRIANFFPDNYDHPIFECGKQLIDMVYLQKKLH